MSVVAISQRQVMLQNGEASGQEILDRSHWTLFLLQDVYKQCKNVIDFNGESPVSSMNLLLSLRKIIGQHNIAVLLPESCTVIFPMKITISLYLVFLK